MPEPGQSIRQTWSQNSRYFTPTSDEEYLYTLN